MKSVWAGLLLYSTIVLDVKPMQVNNHVTTRQYVNYEYVTSDQYGNVHYKRENIDPLTRDVEYHIKDTDVQISYWYQMARIPKLKIIHPSS